MFLEVQVCLLLVAGLKTLRMPKILLGLFGNINTVISCVDVLLLQQNLYGLKY